MLWLPAGPVEGPLDGFPLDVSQHGFQIEPSLGELSRLDHFSQCVQVGRARAGLGAGDGHAQVGAQDLVPLVQEHDPLEQIPQLADVPGPRIRQEDPFRLGFNLAETTFPNVRLNCVKEVAGQRKNVLPALPERRDADREPP